MSDAPVVDALVIGAGFGGLGAALTLAESGAKVLVCEALAYPGGCASTFTRRGWRFETGATLFSGFGEGQLMRGWIDRHGLDVHVDHLDPTIDFRAPGWGLHVPTDRAAFAERLTALPDAPVERIRAFLHEQERVADALWALFDDPSLLPPFSWSTLLTHATRVPAYAPLLRLVNRPVLDVLRRHGLDTWQPIRTYLDALCQITVQCGVAEAEAPFALAATDYAFRGTGHVRGGIGVLASALCGAIERAGGEIRLASRVTGLRREGDLWHADVRGAPVRARQVVANLLPQGIAALVPELSTPLAPLATQVEGGWSACMLYLGIGADAPLRPEAHHVEIVVDANAPLVEGNHLFASVSAADEIDRGPPGTRTVTVSTHVPAARVRDLSPDARAAYVAEVQRTMRDGLEARAPELVRDVRTTMPASPRTWERFTRRAHGCVGGVPRRVGWQNYANMGPSEVARGLWMVGDSAFPGQSTLATALGGVRTAQVMLRR